MGVYGRGTGSHLPSGRVIVRRAAVDVSYIFFRIDVSRFIHVSESPLFADGSGNSKTSLFVLWFTSFVLCRRRVVKPKPEKTLGASFDSAWAEERNRNWVK